MEISLNSGFSTQDVANLLASKDDSAHRQLRVTKAGIVFLADAERDDDQRGIAFCLETWIAGRGYTGADAAKDTDWVKRVERVLRENWPNPSSEFIDSF